MSKRLAQLIAALAVLLTLAACGGAPAAAPTSAPAAAAPTDAPAPTSAPAPTEAQALKIVASTSWVAAFAKAAGASDITTIAPNSIQHPPDYDPKPSDLAAISTADYVLYAGFEGFAARMQEAVGGDSAKLITVATENSPEAIHKEITRLGELFGTADKAAAYLADFDAQYAALSAEVKAKLGDNKPVVVAQAFMVPWVIFAGLTPAGTYGPAPLGPSDLKSLADLKPTVVFENIHMGGGQPVVEASGATKIDLINFPGDDLDLIKVFQANARLIEDGVLAAASSEHVASAHAGDAAPFQVSVAQYYLDTAGFHGMATTISDTAKIDTAYLTTVSRVTKVLKQTAWPADLHEQAQAFLADLDAFAAALTANDVPAAKAASEQVHDAQHELSHELDHWMEHGPALAAESRPFDVSVAQYFLDTAGFHGMATTISDTASIDTAYLTKVTRVSKVLKATTWPAELSEQAQAFLTDLDAFAAALTANDVPAAKAASEQVHDAQHELSHELDHWMEHGPALAAEASTFDVSVAQYFLDTAGFHGMATTISDTAKIDSAYLTTVSRVSKVLKATTWPAELSEQAKAFLADLDSFAAALTANDVPAAKAASEQVHDAQHELSHALDGALGGGGHSH